MTKMKPGSVRIIGGCWRGRRLKVADLSSVRPTPDRVRETLFNWLTPVIVGAHCLDVFAGTGVLGFEALSRGAAYVEMVDQSAQIVNLLQDEAKLLQAEHAVIYQATVPQGLRLPERLFNIAFLDPPYQSDLLLPTCHYLEDRSFLAKQAYIYLEADYEIIPETLPKNWQLIKSQRAGEVYYHLAIRRT